MGRLGQLGHWLRSLFVHERLPPPWLRDVGPGDFEAVGREFAALLRELGGLTPDSRILDVGCGSGRLALALTGTLSGEGHYVGLDVVKGSVRWCERHIARKFSRFAFHHADVRNARYHPGGRMSPSELRFPGGEAAYDLVVLVSVFTHMLPGDQAHYLEEAARVLRPSGRLFATYFLWNDERPTPAPAIAFLHRGDGFRVKDLSLPESAVAVDEALVRTQLAKAGLSVVEPIRYGLWRGADDDEAVTGSNFQDIVLAARTPDAEIRPSAPRRR